MHLRRAIHNRRHYGTGKSANTSDLGKNLQRIWNITGSFFRERVRKSEADS